VFSRGERGCVSGQQGEAVGFPHQKDHHEMERKGKEGGGYVGGEGGGC